MGIHIGLSCIWAHERHVVERGNQEAIIQHSQMDVLLQLKVPGVTGISASYECNCAKSEEVSE